MGKTVIWYFIWGFIVGKISEKIVRSILHVEFPTKHFNMAKLIYRLHMVRGSHYGSHSLWLPNVCIVQVSMSESRRPQHTSGTGCMTLGIWSQEKIIYCSTFARKSKWVIVAYFWAWISKFSLKTMIVKSKVWRRHDPMNTKSRAINLLFGFC